MALRYLKETGGRLVILGAQHNLTGTTRIEVPSRQWQAAGSPSYWVKDGDSYRLPTEQELQDREAAHVKAEKENESKSKRDQALADNEVTVNGNVFQVRPSDLGNLEVKISLMLPEEVTRWKLKDNSVAYVTKEDLESVVTQGIAQSNALWDAHFDEIE